MGTGFFITGTGTGVGKTVVTAGLRTAMRKVVLMPILSMSLPQLEELLNITFNAIKTVIQG